MNLPNSISRKLWLTKFLMPFCLICNFHDSEVAVWRFCNFPATDFSWNQLHMSFWSPKTAILTFFVALNFEFSEIFDIFKCEIFQKSKPPNWLDGQVLTFWNYSNMISRKMWVAGKLLNFHTVTCQFWFHVKSDWQRKAVFDLLNLPKNDFT